MKRHSVSLLLIVVSSLGADPAKVPATKDDSKSLQGVWLVSAAESDGLKVTSPSPEAKYIFEGSKFTLKVGTQLQEGNVKLDSNKDPKTIDLEVTSGIDKGSTYQGIYKFVDDELMLCFPKNTKADRPKELSGNAGNGQTLIVLKHKKE